MAEHAPNLGPSRFGCDAADEFGKIVLVEFKKEKEGDKETV